MRTGPSPLVACALALVTLFAGALAGCRTTARSADAPPSSRTPSPRTTSPEELCRYLIAHWAREVLHDRSGAGLDYQAMGLSGGQYDILRDVVGAARAAQSTQGPAAAAELIDHQAGQRCAERHREGAPTGAPWQ